MGPSENGLSIFRFASNTWYRNELEKTLPIDIDGTKLELMSRWLDAKAHQTWDAGVFGSLLIQLVASSCMTRGFIDS